MIKKAIELKFWFLTLNIWLQFFLKIYSTNGKEGIIILYTIHKINVTFAKCKFSLPIDFYHSPMLLPLIHILTLGALHPRFISPLVSAESSHTSCYVSMSLSISQHIIQLTVSLSGSAIRALALSATFSSAEQQRGQTCEGLIIHITKCVIIATTTGDLDRLLIITC